MAEKKVKRMKKYIRSQSEQIIVEYEQAIKRLPFLFRLKIAWLLIKGEKKK